MPLHSALDLLACLGHLGVAILVLWRPGRSPLALIVGLASIDLFGWNFASFAYEVSHRSEWHWLDLSLSPFSGALLLHAVLVFVGQVRRFRSVLVLSYLSYAVLASGGALAFFLPSANAWIDSPSWTTIFLGTLLPGTTLALVLLVRHVWTSRDEERARAIVMLAALLIGTGAGLSELVDDLGVRVPSLGNVGTLTGMSLVAFMIVRLKFLDRSFSIMAALGSIAVAVLGLAGYLAVFLFTDRRAALVVVAAMTVIFALFAIWRRVLAAQAADRLQMQTLATLGRLSAQMAHDLRNPLAALKGGVQFLKEEVAQDRPLATQAPFLDLISQQVERIEQVVLSYHHLGRVQPQRQTVNLNAMVREVLALQPFVTSKVAVQMHLDEALPEWSVDRDLVAAALENLVRNAVEAMPDGGTLVVRSAAQGKGSVDAVLITVEDTGCGMDARTAERAFDDFFTTKSTGSGLGLAFVRRVVTAHGGKVRLLSKPGRGTTVTFRLPVQQPPAHEAN